MNTLFELTGYKQDTENKSLQQYLQYLSDTHKVKIANGSFSVAIVPPNANFIYKIWAIDPAWEYWLDICMKNQDKPFIPKIYGKVKKFPNFFLRDERIDGHISVVKMEKLDPLTPPFSTYHYNIWEFFRTLMRNASKDELLDRVQLEIANNGDNLFYDSIEQKNAFYDFIDALGWLIGKNGSFDFDIHDGNFMMRGNQIVVLDPIFDYTSFRDNEIFTIPRQMDTSDFLPNGKRTSVNHNLDKKVGFGKHQKTIPAPGNPKNPKSWTDPEYVLKYGWDYNTFENQQFRMFEAVDEIFDKLNWEHMPSAAVEIYLSILDKYFLGKMKVIPVEVNILQQNKDAFKKLLRIVRKHKNKLACLTMLDWVGDDIIANGINAETIHFIKTIGYIIIDNEFKIRMTVLQPQVKDTLQELFDDSEYSN